MWISFVIMTAIIIGGAGLYYYFTIQQDSLNNNGNNFTVNTQTTTTTSPTTSTPTSITVIPVSDSGITWLSEPEKLEDLGLIKTGDDLDNISVEYYKIATINTNEQLILAVSKLNGPGDSYLYRFKKDTDSHYHYLLQNSAIQDIQNVLAILTDKAYDYVDDSTSYQSLSYPDLLKTDKIIFKSTGSSYSARFYKDLENPVKVIDSQYGSIYKIASTSSSESEIVDSSTAYYLRLPDSTVVSYTIKFGFQTDNGVSLITWSDGKKNSNQYTPEGYFGCSASSGITLLADIGNIENRISKIGTTSNGEKIYGVKEDDQIITNAYENYKIGREKDIISKDDFYSRKPVFIYKDGLDDYVLFTGADFRAAVECGKPVIYLYPQKETQVSVKVGADITKSEPTYQNGWEDVLAKPNGELTYQGKNYPYLFWEGKGLGNYPVINSGFVVKKEDIESTLKDHLSKLGLNQKESADFLEFWLPKMPTTPYTRLTWFGTRQMNELAPLLITPKPDTMIRIFLDFAGLKKPINIKSQNLSAPVRSGFTVVEWGGLLRGE